MIWMIFSVLFVVIPAATATIFQLNAWPFDCYPMFSKRLQPERLTFFRIAYQDRNGRLVWWKPHYYKLIETFGQEAQACFASSPPARYRRLDLLFTKIEHCITNDPAAIGALSVCLIKRRFRHDEVIGWQIVDILVARRPPIINREYIDEL
jgi:hypothetical protein